MLLNEFMYYNKETDDFAKDHRYNANRDISVIDKNDTRKTRLTLRQINQLRLTAEAHEQEHASELGLIKRMYGNPVDESEDSL